MIHAGQKCPQFCGIGSAHKQAWKSKNLRPSTMRAVQLGTMYSSITLIHSSALPMMPEIITPRVVSVCDAVTRNSVSSSSSASIFQVLRDSQILGSDTLKLSGTLEKMTMFPQAEDCSQCTENQTRRSTEASRRRLRDMCQDNCETWLDPNRSSCSGGWAARAAGKRTRPTRRRRGAALLEQLASACQRIVSMGEET